MMQLLKLLKKLGVSVLVTSLSLAGILTLASQLPLPGGWHWYTVLTGSMAPTLPVGSLLITRRPAKTKRLLTGTIITFNQPGNVQVLITHRIYEIREGTNMPYFVTKGDANTRPDNWLVSPDQIKGVYLTHLPYLGYGLEFMKSPLGILLLIVFPTLILATLEIRTIIALRVRQQIAAFIQDYEPSGQESKTIKSLLGLIAISAVVFGLSTTAQAAWRSDTVTLSHNQISTVASAPTPPGSICPPLNVTISQENSQTGPGSTNSNTTTIHNECHINIQNIVY